MALDRGSGVARLIALAGHQQLAALRIEPLASATDDEVVALVGPAIQALLDPTRRPGTP